MQHRTLLSIVVGLMSALSVVAQANVVTFDDLPGGVLTDGYGGVDH